MNTLEYLQYHLDTAEQVASIVCRDGFSVSVQAGDIYYCSPRRDRGPWTHVELGYPSERDVRLEEYAEDSSRPLDTVYGWVPIELVVDIIESHGGIIQAYDEGEREDRETLILYNSIIGMLMLGGE